MRKKDGKPKAFISFANKANYTSFSNIRSEKIKCEYFSKHLIASKFRNPMQCITECKILPCPMHQKIFSILTHTILLEFKKYKHIIYHSKWFPNYRYSP